MTAVLDTGSAAEPTADERWAALVRADPDATPFHHPAWAALLAATYGRRAFLLFVEDDDGQPAAGAPFIEVRGLRGRRRWVSLPYTDECPLLAVDAAARERFAAALPGALAAAGAPAAEVRGPVAGLGWTCEAGAVTHVLDLTGGLDAVRARFSRSQVVRNVRRAEREGVRVRAATGAADMEAFYALHLRTRRRQGVPIQPRRFFVQLWERVLEPGLGTILLADAGGPPLAGAVFLTFNGTTIYKFGASDPEGWPLRPNHALFARAIADAVARGDRRLDFGRTDRANGGLRAFKSGWGAAERPLVYSTLGPGGGAEHEGLAQRALGTAIRRSPAVVCRGVGEALYRFAGAR